MFFIFFFSFSAVWFVQSSYWVMIQEGWEGGGRGVYQTVINGTEPIYLVCLSASPVLVTFSSNKLTNLFANILNSTLIYFCKFSKKYPVYSNHQ